MARLLELGAVPASVWTDGAIPVRNLMQTRDWLLSAARVYARDGKGLALLTGTPEHPTALLPLRPLSGGGYRMLGSVDMGESIEMLWRDAAALDDMARGIVALGLPVDFGHYPTATGFADRLHRAQGWRGLTKVRPLEQRAAPTLPLDASWAEPLSKFSSNRRQQIRRKRRKAEALGPVEVTIISPDARTVEATIARAFAIEAKSWKSRAGTALLQDELQARFYQEFGRRMAEQGLMRLCFLTIDGADAAMQYAVVWQNRFWSIKVGYDEQFADVSPGEALQVELLGHCGREGYDSFEFCGKEAPWTRASTDQAIEIAALRTYPLSPRGGMVLARDAWTLARRRLAAAMSR